MSVVGGKLNLFTMVKQKIRWGAAGSPFLPISTKFSFIPVSAVSWAEAIAVQGPARVFAETGLFKQLLSRFGAVLDDTYSNVLNYQLSWEAHGSLIGVSTLNPKSS